MVRNLQSRLEDHLAQLANNGCTRHEDIEHSERVKEDHSKV